MKRIQLHLRNEGLNSSNAHAGPGHALVVFLGWRHLALGATGTLRLWEGRRLGSVAKPDSARVSTSCYLTASHSCPQPIFCTNGDTTTSWALPLESSMRHVRLHLPAALFLC